MRGDERGGGKYRNLYKVKFMISECNYVYKGCLTIYIQRKVSWCINSNFIFYIFIYTFIWRNIDEHSSAEIQTNIYLEKHRRTFICRNIDEHLSGKNIDGHLSGKNIDGHSSGEIQTKNHLEKHIQTDIYLEKQTEITNKHRHEQDLRSLFQLEIPPMVLYL